MFETLSRPRPSKPAAGTAVSLALHALVIGGAVWFTARQVQVEVVREPDKIKFYNEPKGAPAPGPRGPAAPPSSHPPPKAPRRAFAQPTSAPPPEAAPEAMEPQPAAAADADDELPGVPGATGAPGSGAGIAGMGMGGGGGPEAVDPGPRLFDEGRMTPPSRLSGPDPAYTPLALEHEVEGLMAVRCVVTEQGVVHGCRVIRSLPYMDAAVIRALEQRRYRPALLGGQPVAVDYTFQLRLQLPQ